MSAIKSKPIFEECFLAFKCTFPKDHITLECWRRAAGVLEDVTALTTTGRNHSVLPPVDPAYRALCINLCLVLCILRPIVHWPEVTGRVCRPAPMLLKNVYKWSAAAAKSSAVLLPWQKSDLSWGNSLASVSPLVSSAKGGSRPIATSAFSLFAFCSAFHCLLCLLYLAACSTVHSVNFFHKQMNYLPSLCFPHPNNFSEKFGSKGQFKIPKVCNKTV